MAAREAAGVFVGAEARVGARFDAARALLGDLAGGSFLVDTSRLVYGESIRRLQQVVSRLSQVQVSDAGAEWPELVDVRIHQPLMRTETAMLSLRWEAWDPATGLFPAMDADVTLGPGDAATVLKLAGVYRPPPAYTVAGLDRGSVSRAASAMARDFVGTMAEALADPRPDHR